MGKIRVFTYPSIPQSINLLQNSYSDSFCNILHTLQYNQNDRSSKNTVLLNELQTTLTNKLSIPPENFTFDKVNNKDSAIVVSIWINTQYVPLHHSFIQSFKGENANIQEICNSFLNDINDLSCVDQYLQDQILIYLAMARSSSQIYIKNLTPHTLAVIDLLQIFRSAEIVHENSILTINPL
jgi:RNA 3'-terminal phosphate cyclase